MFELVIIAVILSIVASIGWYVLIAIGILKLASAAPIEGRACVQ